MSENAGEHVPFECPSCSTDLETVHEVLTTGGATPPCSAPTADTSTRNR